MQLNNIMTSRQLYIGAGAQNAKKSYDIRNRSSFNAALNVSVDMPDIAGLATDRWTDVGLYAIDRSPKGYSVNEDALSKVKEQLQSEGIDADKRTPTHKVTEEQMEWLNSKYDLKSFSGCSFSEPEFGNFMLDLAYLNVFSFDEVENMYAGIIPQLSDKPQVISAYYYGDPETGDGAGYQDLYAGGTVISGDMPTSHITAKYLKATYPGLSESEYRKMTAEYTAQFQERRKILEQIFGDSDVCIENTGNTFLKINDVSDKLKEDFGIENKYDFSDMYVRTHQTSVEEAVKDLYAASRPLANPKYMQVPVAGDLKELMDSIEKGLADGKPLRDILQDRIDRYAKEFGEEGVVAVGSIQADLILIDPDTGKVIDSMPKGRCVVLSKKIQDMDYATAKAQADDLATFLRYTVLKKETDDPEKVSALISELKEKQSDYDTSRFLPIFYSGGKQGEKNVEYWGKLLGTDGLNWDSLSEEERDEIVDELMRIIAERYSSDNSTDDDLLDEMNKMKLATAAAKIERRSLSELGLAVS